MHIQSDDEYRETLRQFMREHPDATEDDLKLLPRAKTPAEIWAKFNGVGKRQAPENKQHT